MSEVATARPHFERWLVSRQVFSWQHPDRQHATDMDSLDLLEGFQTIRVVEYEYAGPSELLGDQTSVNLGMLSLGVGQYLAGLRSALVRTLIDGKRIAL